jgi:hypothetical protein
MRRVRMDALFQARSSISAGVDMQCKSALAVYSAYSGEKGAALQARMSNR